MRALEAVRFLLELTALTALAVAGASVGWWLAVLLPLLLVVVWGRFIAPKSDHRLDEPLRLAVEVVLFLGVGGALVAAGHVLAGCAVALASIAVAGLLRTTHSRA